MPSEAEPLRLVADAPLEIVAAAEGVKTPTVRGTVYSGGIMRLPGWGPVVVDVRGVAITNPIPLLANHGEGLDMVWLQPPDRVRLRSLG